MIFILICCISKTIHSQNSIDSLWKVYNNPSQNDTVRLNSIYSIAVLYNYNTSDTTFLTVLKQALTFSRKVKQRKHEEKILKQIGIFFYKKGDFNRALTFFTEAFKIAKEVLDTAGLVSCYNNLGLIYDKQANYNKALQYYFFSLKFIEKKGNKDNIEAIYTNIGLVYQNQKEYKNALNYYFKALQLAQKMNNNKKIADLYVNIGNVYTDWKNYSHSLLYFKKAIQISEKTGDIEGIAWCYTNIGRVFEEQANYTEALSVFKKALQISEKIGDRAYLAYCYANMGAIYNSMANYKLAIKYTNKGLDRFKQIGAIDKISFCYGNLATSYSKIGQYKEAYNYHVKYKQLTDSIFNSANSIEFNNIKTNFEVEKKEIELNTKAKLEQQILKNNSRLDNKKHRIIIVAICFILFIVVIFLVIIYNRFRISQKQKQTIENQKKQLEINITYIQELQEALKYDLKQYKQLALRKQMNPHFIFNSLNSIQSYILQNDKLSANNYLHKFSKLTRKVLDNLRTEYVTIKDELETLQLYIDLEKKRFENQFEYVLEVSELLDTSLFVIPPLIIQPYVENAIWHGLLHNDCLGTLTIKLLLKESNIICIIEDNGIGINASKEFKKNKQKNHESYGSDITEKRLEILNSLNDMAISVEYIDLKDEDNNLSGTRVTLLFPAINNLA